LDSLLFNDSIGAYTSLALFVVFGWIDVLIDGVVLPMHNKPEPKGLVGDKLGAPPRRQNGKCKSTRAGAM
jgi:hypothetical protein